jgi:hypothetical protein
MSHGGPATLLPILDPPKPRISLVDNNGGMLGIPRLVPEETGFEAVTFILSDYSARKVRVT